MTGYKYNLKVYKFMNFINVFLGIFFRFLYFICDHTKDISPRNVQLLLIDAFHKNIRNLYIFGYMIKPFFFFAKSK